MTPMYWKTTSGRTLYFFDTAACKRCVKTTRDEVSVIMALELHEGERFMLKCLVDERILFLLLANVHGKFDQLAVVKPIGESVHE